MLFFNFFVNKTTKIKQNHENTLLMIISTDGRTVGITA